MRQVCLFAPCGAGQLGTGHVVERALRDGTLGRTRRPWRPVSGHRRVGLSSAAPRVHAATGSAEVDGRRIGVVGLGKVGYVLAARLAQAGGRIVACDLDAARCERFTSEYGGEIAPSAEAIMSTGPGYASFRWPA